MAALQHCVKNDLNHLFQRRYKVDELGLSGQALSAGQKVWRNWIVAQDFLRITQSSADVQKRHRAISDLKARCGEAVEAWLRLHPGIAVAGSFTVDDQGAIHVVVGDEREEEVLGDA